MQITPRLAPRAHSRNPVDTNVRTVLVVQSDYTLRRAIESVLASSGSYRVLATGDPDVAYNILSRESIDAVLLDVDLPTMSGPALYLAMVLRWPNLRGRIAIMTDDAQTERLRGWVDLNPGTVLRKPFRFDLFSRWPESALQPKGQEATG